MEQPQSEFNLSAVSSIRTDKAQIEEPPSTSTSAEMTGSASNRDFHNPMYEAMGSMETEAELEAVRGTSDAMMQGAALDLDNGAAAVDNSHPHFTEPPSAIIAPSSVIQKESPKISMRRKELNPSQVDLGKDTQCLVEEGDSSEC